MQIVASSLPGILETKINGIALRKDLGFKSFNGLGNLAGELKCLNEFYREGKLTFRYYHQHNNSNSKKFGFDMPTFKAL